MSDSATAVRVGDRIIVRFDGLDAARHEIDMALLADSMRGLARVIGVSGNFAATGRVILHRDAFALKVVVTPPQTHCFEFVASLQWINQNPLITTVAGGLVVTLVTYIFKKAAGDREEMKQLRGALDTAIHELGNRDQAVVDRLLTTIDKMADSLRPAVRQAVAPIGETASQMTIGGEAGSKPVAFDAADKAAILSESPMEVGPEATYLVKFTELDMETGSCKIALEPDSENRLSAKITDPAFSLANNPYVLAMAAQAFVRVNAKPILRDGEMERLFISDMPDRTKREVAT